MAKISQYRLVIFLIWWRLRAQRPHQTAKITRYRRHTVPDCPVPGTRGRAAPAGTR
jgi:hypothetical protein